MNIFEGGRRLLLVMSVVSIVAAGFSFDGVSYTEKPINLAIWIAGLWAIAWSVGWVIRGFMGIP